MQRQLDQRTCFALLVAFLHPITFLLNLGFAGKAKSKSVTGYNVALAYALQNAMSQL